MAEPLAGPSMDEERLIRDYLGVLAPESFRGQPALPTAAPIIPQGAAPAGAGGGRALELVGPSPRRPTASPEASQTLRRALQALGLGETAIKGIRGLLEPAPEPPAPSRPSIVPTPDLPAEGVIGTGTAAPAGAAIEPAAVAGEQTAAAAAELPTTGFSLAELGPYAAYLGPALSIAMRGARGDEPVGTQAGKAAVETGAATAGLLAASTLGGPVGALIAAAPLVAQTLTDVLPPGFISTVDPIFGPGIEAVYGHGQYVPERQRAARQATAGLTALGDTYEAAARSGDPEQVFHALRSGEAGGRVRSTLSLPQDVAASLGVPAGTVEWSSLSPEQFTRLLTVYQERPELIDFIGGSGDVPYMSQANAQSVAGSAARGARQLVKLLLAQRAIGGMTPTAPAPSFGDLAAETVSAPAGGPAGLRTLRPEEEPVPA